ncbi:MAG: lycopene cyclase domain-containing protein [Proteobacteria bacterium]|jgi:lycopene cyclase domain-containing protein|nr:lycopene cyclase domain-containing protein [Pseudomonadota bacterium]
MSAYMYVLIISGIIPVLASFWPPLRFYRNIKALLYSITLIVILFWLWDVFAIYRGHWWFNPAGVWQARIFNMPVEEGLFFVVIPFCCIFTWEVVNYLGKKKS